MVYKTGETVSGKVIFQNNGQCELKLKNIVIELAGEIVYYSSRGSGTARTTDIHVHSFFDEQNIVRSASGGNNFILERGEHIWPFSFHLMDNLPSTLNQSRHKGPCIRYVVRIHFVRSEWFKRRIQKASFITVQHHTTSPMLSNEYMDEKQNNQSVHLQAILHENIVTPGEKCPCTITILNPNRITIRRLSMTLIRYHQLGSAGNDNVIIVKKDLNGIDDFQDERWQNNFDIQIPEGIVSSYSDIPPQWSTRKPLEIRYELYLEVHIRGIYTNVCLRLPLTVAHTKQKKVNLDSFPPRYDKIFLF